jgi:hypothetical protein
MSRILSLLTGFSMLISLHSQGQEEAKKEVSETFSAVRIINGHSTETLKKRQFRYIIAHRFGDALGDQGGVQTAFGFDNAADIRFGFDFGLTDNLMVGISRLKGSGPYRSILEGSAKYRFLTQTEDNKMPVSISFAGSAYGTYMPSSEDISSVTYFERFSHRMMYGSQLTIARKFHPRFSMALMPSYVHRNLVEDTDVNGLFSVGAAARIRLNKSLGLIAEYFYNIHSGDVRQDYKNSLGVALEWLTNGHTFTFNFTNARGFGEAQYIALTRSDWLEGQFRLGFSITRTFTY